MDADEFIKDNIQDNGRNTTGNVFNGTIYYWNHFGEKDSHILREYVGGYATYNLTGKASAYSNDTRIDHSNPNNTDSKEPEQYIPVGQGFFVIAALDPDIAGTTATVSGGDIVFKNSQRAFKTEGSGESVFMKSANVKNKTVKAKQVEDVNDERHKIWLMYDSPKGYHRQLLIGTDSNATNGFDIGYDGFIADIGKEDMFWIIDGAKFVIQGVQNFNSKQEFPIGLKVNETGLVRIKIDELKNIDSAVKIYIKDNSSGETYEITSQPFEVNLEAGDYINRFSVVFRPRLLKINEIDLDKGVISYMNNTTSELIITRTLDTELTGVKLFNTIGQLIKTWDSKFNDERKLVLPIDVATGVYFIRINTTSGALDKKIIIN